jgi:hypothetical protein
LIEFNIYMGPLTIIALVLGGLLILRILLHFVMPSLRLGIGFLLIIAIIILAAVIGYLIYNGATLSEIFVW